MIEMTKIKLQFMQCMQPQSDFHNKTTTWAWQGKTKQKGLQLRKYKYKGKSIY